ncbi:MAG: hypothetical protein JF595_10045 [Sphingomonadales bacterium]|nr:hypothetical protein [Sphingomonadales bacterium]
MAHFKLIPTDDPMNVIEFDARSAAAVLDRTLRHDLGETDVYEDGPYKCTVRHGDDGVWTITQRKIALRYGSKLFAPAAAITAPRTDLKALFVPQREMA